MGYQPMELIDKRVYKYIHPDDIYHVFNSLKEAYNGNGSISMEYRCKHKNGNYLYLHSRGNMLEPEKKRFILVNRKFTEKKNAEQKLKKTEHQLKESEIFFRLITENIYDLIAVLSYKYEFEYINENVHINVLGYSNEDLIGKSALNLIHPKDIESSIKRWRTGAKTGGGTTELRFKKKDGEYIWLEIRGKRFKDSDGVFKGIIISRDITKRKKTEQKLKESEEKYSKIFHTDPNLMAISRLEDGKYIEVNQSFLNTLGYRREEVIGKKPTELNIPVDPSYRNIMKEKIKKNGEFRNLDVHFRLKSGEIRKGILSGVILDIGEEKCLITLMVDITELKNAEQLLKESEEKYRELFNSLDDAVFILDKSNKFLEVNTTACKRYDYTRYELLKMNPYEINAPEVLKKVSENIKNVKEFGHEIFETVHLTKAGKRIPVEINASTINYKGKFAILAIVRNITKRKKAEKKLKNSEERLRNFFEASPIGIEIFDSEGSLIQANKACLGIFGVVDYNEIIGFKLFEDPNVTDKAKKNLKNGKSIRYISIFDFEKVKEFNLYRTTKSGRIIIDRLITPLFQNEQNIIGYLVQIQDITEREMYQERLKKSEMKFRHLFEGSPYSIVLFNLDGFVIDCNSNTESLFNLPKHKIIGKNYQSIPIFKSEIFLMLKMGLRVVKEGITEESKEKVFESDGKQIWINCLLSLVKLGEEYFIQAILRDITSKKIYERIAYEQNKKLSDISNLKSELMRRASHELKTPLISIKGFSDLLLSLHYHKFDDDTITIIEEIKDGCLRLENLISIILKSSKLESGKIKLDAKQDDLSFLINYCVQELGMLFKMRDQKVKLKISNNLITKFEKERIYEVLSNLLTNAIKYSPPFSEIEIKSKSKKDFIITSVKDKGIGFTEEEKKMIFKQFGKIERYGQGWDIGTGGTGLGLYIALKIVELHGGRIWVESEGKNMGSTFYFTLPIIKD